MSLVSYAFPACPRVQEIQDLSLRSTTSFNLQLESAPSKSQLLSTHHLQQLLPLHHHLQQPPLPPLHHLLQQLLLLGLHKLCSNFYLLHCSFMLKDSAHYPFSCIYPLCSIIKCKPHKCLHVQATKIVSTDCYIVT